MNTAIFVFIIACGFVTAALLHNAQLAVRGQSSGFQISIDHTGRFLASFLMVMFIGPYVVLERGLAFWRLGNISIILLICCTFLALLWSFCSGIFVTQLLIVLGIVTL